MGSQIRALQQGATKLSQQLLVQCILTTEPHDGIDRATLGLLCRHLAGLSSPRAPALQSFRISKHGLQGLVSLIATLPKACHHLLRVAVAIRCEGELTQLPLRFLERVTRCLRWSTPCNAQRRQGCDDHHPQQSRWPLQNQGGPWPPCSLTLHTSVGSGPVRLAALACWKRSRSFSTSTAIVAPAGNVPPRIALAIGVSSSR